jgi:uncharacterized protein
MVPLKKYFYVLRPLLSVKWLERYGTAAPIEFHKLLHLLDGQPQLLRDIDLLLEKKRTAPEMGLSTPVASLNSYIEAELARLDGTPVERSSRDGEIGELNRLFHATLRE